MELVERFESAARSVAARCARIDRSEIEAGTAAYLRGLGVGTVAVDSKLVRLEGFAHVEAERADCGVTDVEFGIASTGTMALEYGPSTRRMVSLLPPVHVGLLSADSLVPDLGAALTRLGPRMTKEGRPSGVVFVTGPSRTADIELNLVIGVHGPREVHVLIYG